MTERKPSRQKIWVGIKRGLIRDPKHRIAMGESRWLYDYMIDIADWETGIISGWRDESAAADMEMQVRTLRDQRRKLDNLGYITCRQGQHDQEIVIHKWVNPRSFSGEVLNNFQDDARSTSLNKSQGDTQGDTQGDSESVTPTYDSHNQMSLNVNQRIAILAKLYQDNITMIVPIMAERLKDAAEEFTDASWYAPAFGIAVENNARNWAYVYTILGNWKKYGRDWKPATMKKKKQTAGEDLKQALEAYQVEE